MCLTLHIISLSTSGQFNTFWKWFLCWKSNAMWIPFVKILYEDEDWPPHISTLDREKFGFEWKVVVVRCACGVISWVVMYSWLWNPMACESCSRSVICKCKKNNSSNSRQFGSLMWQILWNNSYKLTFTFYFHGKQPSKVSTIILTIL